MDRLTFAFSHLILIIGSSIPYCALLAPSKLLWLPLLRVSALVLAAVSSATVELGAVVMPLAVAVVVVVVIVVVVVVAGASLSFCSDRVHSLNAATRALSSCRHHNERDSHIISSDTHVVAVLSVFFDLASTCDHTSPCTLLKTVNYT
jgi:hypothetical protein